MGGQVSRQMLEEAYEREKDADVRLRILLVMRVLLDGVKAIQASKELHRVRSWATKWLRRFEEGGLEGLRTKWSNGRPPKMERETMLQIRRRVVRRQSGWTAREVRVLIHREAGVTYSERQVYRLIHRWGLRSIVPQKRFINKASKEEIEDFKKRQGDC